MRVLPHNMALTSTKSLCLHNKACTTHNIACLIQHRADGMPKITSTGTLQSTWVEMTDGHCHLVTIPAKNRLPVEEAVCRWASNTG